MENSIRNVLIVATAPTLTAVTGIEFLSRWAGDDMFAACAMSVRVVAITGLTIWLLANHFRIVSTENRSEA
ncbi:MAG: hypothetical protein R3C05_01135 [Pirellulaceae bacterium]